MAGTQPVKTNFAHCVCTRAELETSHVPAVVSSSRHSTLDSSSVRSTYVQYVSCAVLYDRSEAYLTLGGNFVLTVLTLEHLHICHFYDGTSLSLEAGKDYLATIFLRLTLLLQLHYLYLLHSCNFHHLAE